MGKVNQANGATDPWPARTLGWMLGSDGSIRSARSRHDDNGLSPQSTAKPVLPPGQTLNRAPGSRICELRAARAMKRSPASTSCCSERRASRSNVAVRPCHTYGETTSSDVAMQSADDALMKVLSKLDSYRGDSKFTTWAYKFALLEAAVNLQRRAWQGREVPLEPETWSFFSAKAPSPQSRAECGELFEVLQDAISNELTPHQREVLVATTMNGVPIDVLARTAQLHKGSSLQDTSRRPPQAAQASRHAGIEPRGSSKMTMTDRTLSALCIGIQR